MSIRSLSMVFALAGVASFGVACGGGSSGDDDPTPDAGSSTILEPPPPGQGYQYVMNTVIGAGTEVEHCMFVQGPADTFYINRDEVRYTSGSHHFLLYETPYTSIPTQKEDGTPVDTSGVFDCSDGASNGWRITRVIGGSQNGNGESALTFPSNVGMEVPGNRVLLMNAHYINASDQPLEPEVRINLWTIPESQVEHLGDIMFIYNPFIRVKAKSSERARWQCPVHQDITLINVQSHMHARGVDYAVSVLGQEPFYTNDRWENVPIGRFDPGLQIPAGSVLDYHCDYINPETRDIYQGPRTTDEMCMLLGSYYPADSRTSNCSDATDTRYGGVWVGQGKATCAATWSCLLSSSGLESATDCVMASDPTVAPEMSAALACVIAASDPSTECASQVQACQAK